MQIKALLQIFIVLLLSLGLSGKSSAAGLMDGRLNISGYGNAHFMSGMNGMAKQVDIPDPNNSVAQLREFSLFIDALPVDGITISTELSAAENGENITAIYGYVDVDVSGLIDAWDDEQLGNFSFRAGRILVPFLSYNENKANFKQTLMSAPFTAWNIAPVNPAMGAHAHGAYGWSDAGAMIDWNHMVGDLGIVDLKVAMINGLGSESDVLDDNTIQLDAWTTMQMGMGMTSTFQPTVRPRDGLVGNREETEAHDNNNDKAIVTKLTFSSSDIPLDIGTSYYHGAWDEDADHELEILGVHFNLLFRDWTLKGEYALARVEQDAGINVVEEDGPDAINESTDDYHMEAWYVEGSVIPIRYGEKDDRYLRLIFRYDDLDTNDEALFTPFDRWRLTPGVEWQFVNYVRLRYEYQYSEIADFGEAPQAYKDAGGKSKIDMHMASIIFYF